VNRKRETGKRKRTQRGGGGARGRRDRAKIKGIFPRLKKASVRAKKEKNGGKKKAA